MQARAWVGGLRLLRSHARRCGVGRGQDGERGQAFVLTAIILPLVLLVATIAIDVGNWWVHRRHLQTLVDAGALAAAPKFVGCSFQFGDMAAANLAIRDKALEYAGDTTRDPATRNLQVEEPNDVHVVLNGQRYWTDGDLTDGTGLDYTWDIDGSGGGGDPCSERSLDVKATDDDAPLLFGFIPYVADPKRHARIEVRQVIEQNGFLPWAVPELEPAAVAAIFVNETTGALLAPPQQLDQYDDASLPFLEWTSSPGGAPSLVPRIDLVGENMGVIILVSKVLSFPELDLSGSLAEICSRYDPALVACYGGDGQTDGLAFIHGWSDANGTPANPVVRDVSVLNQTCEDFSAPYFLKTGDCQVGARAVIHFGTDPGFNPQNAQVALFAPGCNKTNGCAMAYIGAGGIGEGIFQTTQYAKFADDFCGRANFDIRVKTVFPPGTTNTRTFTGVAHPFVAEPADLQGNVAQCAPDAGPVEYLKLSTIDPVPDAYSRNNGDPPTASVIVTVGFRKPFQIESPLAPPIVLRVASPSGSRNQAIDCDKPYNFEHEIEFGCFTTYRENYGDWGPPTCATAGVNCWRDILCSDWPNGTGLPPTTFDPIPVPDCARIETGDKIGQFRQGIRSRLKNPTCAPNNWPEELSDFPDFFQQIDSTNDPRYVSLIVTDFGTFFGQGGSGAVPVKYFAGFYITGWDKVGNNPDCADNEPHPWYPAGYRKSLDNGDVWGHFINVVIFSANGRGSDDLCDFDEVGTCIIGLVE